MTFVSDPLVTSGEDTGATGCAQGIVFDVSCTGSADSTSGSAIDHLAHIALDLLIDDERGRWRLAPTGDSSWQAVRVGDDGIRIHAHAADDLATAGSRS